jgi:hypothetical protein
MASFHPQERLQRLIGQLHSNQTAAPVAAATK